MTFVPRKIGGEGSLMRTEPHCPGDLQECPYAKMLSQRLNISPESGVDKKGML